MSGAEVFKVRSRLADQIGREGGMTAGMAVERASRELAKTEDASRDAVAEVIDQLERLGRDQTASMDEVYDLASAVLDIAGLYDETLLCKAAYSLCELTDKLRMAGRSDWPPVLVHVEGLRLILNTDITRHDELAPMVEGLCKVSARLREPTKPEA